MPVSMAIRNKQPKELFLLRKLVLGNKSQVTAETVAERINLATAPALQPICSQSLQNWIIIQIT